LTRSASGTFASSTVLLARSPFRPPIHSRAGVHPKTTVAFRQTNLTTPPIRLLCFPCRTL
jgi:hypothetical protein